MKILRKEFAAPDFAEALKALPKHDGSEWCVMSAEVPAEDEHGGDVVRVDGMSVPTGIPIQAQHLKHAPDGSPTTIGKLEETRDGEVVWKGQTVKAKFGRFAWAPGVLATKYRELWEGGFVNRVSIGAFVKDAEPLDKKNPRLGYDIKKSELFELSIVTFGANPAAQAIKAIKDQLGDALEEPKEEPCLSLKFKLSAESLAEAEKQLKGLYSDSASPILSLIEKKLCSLEQKISSRLDDLESAIVAQAEKEAAPPATELQPGDSENDEALLATLRAFKAALKA